MDLISITRLEFPPVNSLFAQQCGLGRKGNLMEICEHKETKRSREAMRTGNQN